MALTGADFCQAQHLRLRHNTYVSGHRAWPWALTFETFGTHTHTFWQATGLGLGPDSRFLRLEANCVHTHLDINEVVEKYKRFAIAKVVSLHIVSCGNEV